LAHYQPIGWVQPVAEVEMAKSMGFLLLRAAGRAVGAALSARVGRFRAWPSRHNLIDEPLSLAEAETHRLRRIYDKAGEHLWDGAAVFREAVHKHGGIQLDREKRVALSHLITMLMWGELAAWIVSADLAERLDDVEAKMAATSQAFDEARHFYVMRDYLLTLGIDLPPLDGYTQAVLRELLSIDSLERKLIGMQLIVENVALGIFRAVARARVEPVLADLMPYYERDEARHIGLGVLYLPQLLEGISVVEAARLKWFQFKIMTLVVWGTRLLRPEFGRLGIDVHSALLEGIERQNATLGEMSRVAGGRLRGIYRASGRMERVNQLAVNLFFPPPHQPQTREQVRVNEALQRVAHQADRLLKILT
jgi:hypothetical protein